MLPAEVLAALVRSADATLDDDAVAAVAAGLGVWLDGWTLPPDTATLLAEVVNRVEYWAATHPDARPPVLVDDGVPPEDPAALLA